MDWKKSGWLVVIILIILALKGGFILRSIIVAPPRGNTIKTDQAVVEQTSSNWKTYTQPLFSAQFPSKPNLGSETGEMASAHGFLNNDIYTSHNGEDQDDLMLVEAGEFLSSIDTTNPDQILQDSYNKIKEIQGVQIDQASYITVRGNKALKVFYDTPPIGQYTKSIFLFWNGTPYNLPDRYYALGELSKGDPRDSDDFDTLVNSFQVIH